MISINKPTAAFIKQYRESGGGAQLLNISVVDPAELVKLAGLKNAHGLGISQVVPYPYMANLPVIREYQELLKKYAPEQQVNYTNFEEFLGAKVLVEATAPRRPEPDARQGDEGAREHGQLRPGRHHGRTTRRAIGSARASSRSRSSEAPASC